jgi:putative acetyltransferase
MLIRPEEPEDVAAIHKLVAAAFPSDAEARLVDLLRDAGRLTVSLVAVLPNGNDHSQLVGHVAFSPVTTPDSDIRRVGLCLAPLAVAEESRRQGIGATLVRAGLEACREYGANYVVVVGEPEYYERFGFKPGDRFELTSAYAGPFFQIVELTGGGSPRGRGLVKFAPEFDMFG